MDIRWRFIIGNVIGFNPANQIARTIAIYQNPGFDLHGWHPYPFGTQYTRNQAYADLVDFLQPVIKQAFDSAGMKLIDATLDMENHIATQLTNFIVQRWLGNTSTSDLSQVTRGTFLWNLPNYTLAQKEQLRTLQSRISPELSLSLTTHDENEKTVLNARLANQAIGVLRSTPELGAEITRMLSSFTAAATRSEVDRNRLFAALPESEREAIKRASEPGKQKN